MDDLVERLRHQPLKGPGVYQSLCLIAAIEIERLREEVTLWKDRYEAADQALTASIADFNKYEQSR